MHKLALLFAFLLFSFVVDAQVVINEASNRNYKIVADEDGDYPDWIELYNTSSNTVDLSGWSISDSRVNMSKWVFGNVVLPAHGHVLLFASGKDRKPVASATDTKWGSAVLPEDQFRYIIPDENTLSNWNRIGFNDSNWQTGQSGFGYGDGDDKTILPNGTTSVFTRIQFNIPDTAAILSAILHVDYDDGFVAYLNGFEIARSMISGEPKWNSLATGNHEAVMYTGSNPEAFAFDNATIKKFIRQGTNLLAIQAHNIDNNSSDFSLIPFLSFKTIGNTTYFRNVPTWLEQTGTTKNNLLHTNFKIDSKGEMIFLFNKSGILADSLQIPQMQIGHSYGREKDGASKYAYFMAASPGGSNNNSKAFVNGIAPIPSFSHKAGFYKSKFNVSISSPDPMATIRFTLDGSDPVETSAKYVSPIEITSTQSLRARCFVAEKVPSDIKTASYFINQEYTVPVLSVNTNNSNLYGNEGIFTQWRLDFDVPSYVEYFGKDKQLAFSQLAGMQIDGGAGGSRSHEQHSFRIEPGNGTLGEGDLKYKLMPRRMHRSSFSSFYVRNGSNQYLVLPYKDALQVAALGSNTYTYYSAYHPISVFINGSYFGLYELREKINKDYLISNYDMDTDSLDLLGVSYWKGLTIGSGTLYALEGSADNYFADFNKFQQLNKKAANFLDEMGKFLDIKSYTDYMIANIWVANKDWPYNNIKVFRCKGTEMKWRWAIIDLEWSFKPYPNWSDATTDAIQFVKDYGQNATYTGFWYTMMENSLNYKAYFINRFADLMNTSYHSNVICPMEQEYYEEFLPEMENELKRWSNSNIPTKLSTFTKNHETFNSELDIRSVYMREHLQKHYGLKKQVTVTLEVEPAGGGSIQISTIIPDNYPWQGIYFSDIDVEVSALPNIGYKFSGWDSNSFVKDVKQQILKGKFNTDEITLRASFEPSEFNDNGVVISEINYKTGNNYNCPDWLEICNLSHSIVNLKGWSFTDKSSTNVFTFDADTYLDPNKRLVVTNFKENFRAFHPNVEVYYKEFDFGFGSPSDDISLFDDQKKKVFSVKYNDLYPWPLNEDFSGRTLELRTPQADANQPTAWFKGCIGGSPGEAFSPCTDENNSYEQVNVPNKFELLAFPNPASDFINVQMFIDDDANSCEITLFDMSGRVVLKNNLGRLKNGWHNHQLPLSTIKDKILILKVKTDKQEKFIKVIKR